MARDILMSVLQHLGFMINFQKSLLTPTHVIQFLRVEVDSMNLKLSLLQEKIEKIITQCRSLLAAQEVTVRDLMRLIGRLSASAVSCSSSSPSIQGFAKTTNSTIVFEQELRVEGDSNRGSERRTELVVSQSTVVKRSFSNLCTPQLVIASDASLQGWGACCQGQRTGGQWSFQEKEMHINFLELKAAKLAIISFHRLFPESLSIHIQIDNIVALTFLIKMEGTRSEVSTAVSKEIWRYLLDHQITITVEYLPGVLNVEADTCHDL